MSDIMGVIETMLQPERLAKHYSVTRFLLAFFAFLLLAHNLPAQTWNWTAEEVDLQGESTWIVADTDGNLHVSYYAATGGQLKYAFRSVETSKWFTMTLEQGLGFFVTRITVDAN